MNKLFLILALLFAIPAHAEIVSGANGSGGGGSSGIAIGTTTITGGTSGAFLYDNGGVAGNLTPPNAITNISSGIFIDPRAAAYGAKCDGAVWSAVTGRPVQQGTDDDSTAFNLAGVAAQAVGGMVMVPDGCWGSHVLGVTGASYVGQGWSPNYGYDAGTNGQPYTRPVFYVIGDPAVAWDFNGGENEALVGFEINAVSNSGAASATSCVGSTSGSSGFGGKDWLYFMSFKGCANGVKPTGGYVYLVSYNNDYGNTGYGIAGTFSDLLSNNDTFTSGTAGISCDSGNGGLIRVANDRFEFLTYGIKATACGQINIDNTQFDHFTYAALGLSGTNLLEMTNGALKAGGLGGSLTVTGTASGTGGVVRLTVNSANTSFSGGTVTGALSTGDKITVTGVGGTTEANVTGATITVVDSTHIELQGTTYSHAYTSGGFGGVWGKDADVLVGSNTTYLSFSNVGWYNSTSEGQASAPAFGIDENASGSDYIAIRDGAASTAVGSWSMGVANWETFGTPAHFRYDAQGAAPFINDNSTFSINASGGVGLGTSNAVNVLDVSGAVAIGTSYAGVKTAPTNGMISVGSVGIGTSSPISQLQVQSSTVAASGSVQAGTWVGGTFGTIYLGGNFATSNSYNLLSSGTDLFINRPSGSPIHFRENQGSDQMTILSGGNVGIGSSTPAAALDVAGAVVSEPVTLTISTATFTPVAVNSNTNRVVLIHASCPCTIANPSGTAKDGDRFLLEIWQSSTGSDTIGTWGTNYDFGTAGAPTLSTGANKGDLLGFTYSAQNSKYNYIGIQQGL